MNIGLWEILVPTVKDEATQKFYTLRYHKVWDAKIRAIAGGLTVLSPIKGQWVGPRDAVFNERMIPVRIAATKEQIMQVINITLEYYDQEAVMAYRISDEVIIQMRKE